MTHSASIIASIPPVLVSIDAIAVAPENPRSDDTVDQAALETLADNIATQGVLTPLIGYLDDGTAWITAGGRRTRALKLLAERGAANGLQVPVIFRDKHLAIEAGHAEQLTHERMSAIDELRIFQMQAYEGMTDAELGANVGRSARYVAQRRKILSLPAEAVAATLDGTISIDQAIGFTYFGGREKDLLACLAGVVKNRSRTGEWIRREALSNVGRDWSSFDFVTGDKPLVTLSDYELAGGRVQSDMFADACIVLDPDVLMTLANEGSKARAEAALKGWGAIVQKGERGDHNYYWRPGFDDRHRGVDKLTEEERTEFRADPKWKIDADMKSAREDGDAEAEQSATARLERHEHLAKRSEPSHPAALKKLLEAWWIPTDRYPYFESSTAVLHDDREALYAAGYLQRPKPMEKDANALPQSLRDRISRILTQALRMHFAKDPDRVIARHVVAMHGPLGYSAVFGDRPSDATKPGPEVSFHAHEAWDEMLDLAGMDLPPLGGLTDENYRKMTAHRMLLCLRDTAPRDELKPELVREVWTPDADFLKAYNAAQIETMRAQLDGDGTFGPGGQKKAAAVEHLANLATFRNDWLPIGFDGIGGAA